MQGATVIIVDDDAAVRDSLQALLDAAGYATESYPSGTEFLGNFRCRAKACVLLDVRMPKMDGLGVLQALRAARPSPAIIMIAGAEDVEMAVRAMRSGVVSFLQKPFLEDELLESIEYALSLFGDSDYRIAASEAAQQKLERLTQRERQALELVVTGKSNPEIAQELSCTLRTAEIYRARILEKMGAGGLPQLMHVVFLAGVQITEK